jgi:hypothetical protein
MAVFHDFNPGPAFPAPLFLVDPLAYSDDALLDAIIEIISEASTRMQVV